MKCANELIAGWHQRLFAWALAHLNGKYETRLADTKRALFSDLSGTVIEIGPGTGANLPYFSRDVRWIGVEPNPYMDRYLQKRANVLGIPIEIRRGTAEDLPAPDCCADAVVSTLVLCSVSNLSKSLSEVLRVLKPGGRLIFIEHVAAPRGNGSGVFRSGSSRPGSDWGRIVILIVRRGWHWSTPASLKLTIRVSEFRCLWLVHRSPEWR